MKKISTSFILSLAASIWAFAGSYLFPDVTIEAGGAAEFALRTMALGLPATALYLLTIILILLGCHELKARQPAFGRQFKLYIAVYAANFAVSLVPSIVWAMGRYLSFASANPFYFLYAPLSFALTAFQLYVGWSLVKNIKLLGYGGDIGHRALRTAWLVSAALTAYRTLIDLVNSIFAVTQRESGILESLFPNASTTLWSAYSATIQIAGLVLTGIFTVCLVLTTIKIERIQPPQSNI
ncbi:MAG: hypothetical protein LBT21_03265 [Oscillospiraceae bacterium]|jgi:hypothetical protein|nr:hypothetical protein [Oscillospiraceae bacterium]